MQGASFIDNDFLIKLTDIIIENISDEMFGVSELASEIGMSRSNLLRKIKKSTNLSASQFIRQVRLEKAMEMLKQTSLTVSEVSYKVGFSSTSYFIKCFGDEYGFPPGEVGKKSNAGNSDFRAQSQTHQLAAIMFTDIQGYTALMQQDEEKAIKFRNRHREVFNAATEKFKGKILQYYGDGTLSTFNSAIDAVRCGIELQLAFREEPRIPVRVGIHTGDILFSEDGIVGDGVNVASRIESLAVPQSVFISEKVYDEVKNQTGIQTTSMGVFELKNVEKPMEIFAITNPGLVVPEKNQITGKVKRESTQDKNEIPVKRKGAGLKWVFIVFTVILVGYLLYTSDIFKKTAQPDQASEQSITKKSIAVLPFRNDSNDSSNVYIINGLMESTLNNLQKIKDLRVISRTSVEKYRNSSKTIPEIGNELNVRYLIEGSGQKIGDQILLHIQLIEASSDKHVWGEEYNREAKDIFTLQREIAENIIDQIQVIITPEEEEMINKAPTDNVVAYDYFLKGYDLLITTRAPAKLEEAITYFEKAIEEDPKFARAHAAIAISYYYLDEFKVEKKYAEEINHYADQALLLDDKLPQSLIAKALFYMHDKEYELAVSYLEKALEYNPNDGLAYVFLIDVYKNYIPNTEKYLEYALKGINLDVSDYDSLFASFNYLQISNAFVQSGFIEEADQFINKSLAYYSDNQYSKHLQAYILFAKNQDLQQLKRQLIEILQRDSTNLDIMQDVGKICYFQRDWASSYQYYKKFNEIRAALKLDIFKGENAKIGLVLAKMGLTEESEKYFKNFLDYANNDQTIYKHLSLSAYYAYMGEKEEAIAQLRMFAQQDNYYYWILPFLEIEPLMDNIKDLPEFKEIVEEIDAKFWKYHNQIRLSLEQKGLI